MNYAPVRVCMNSYTYESFNDIQTHNARPQLTFWNLCFMYFHRSLPRSFAISYRQLFICFFFRTFENRQMELLNAAEDKKKIKNKTKRYSDLRVVASILARFSSILSESFECESTKY